MVTKGFVGFLHYFILCWGHKMFTLGS